MHFNHPKNLIGASSKQHQQYTIYIVVFFAVILLLAISLVLVSDYRRFEKQFAIDIELINARFNFYLKHNESVMEALSAFVAGVGQIDKRKLDRYAKQVNVHFPHIYMLEVAKRVRHEDLAEFIRQRRRNGHADFTVKAFDYEGNRQWTKPKVRDEHFPIVYLYPENKESHEILGLDVASHEFLYQPLKKSFEDGGRQISLPFKLIEGPRAFIMFQGVNAKNTSLRDTFVAMVVVTEKNFSFDDLLDDSLGLLIYHSALPVDNEQSHFFNKQLERNYFLPRFVFETAVTGLEPEDLKLVISKQFRFSDISWIVLLIVTHILLSLFFITREMMRKNRETQEKLLKASQQQHKMIAVSNLTGGLAHEFNNNLSVVRGFLSLLEERFKFDIDAKNWIDLAEKATEKSIQLTHKLLTYSRYKGIRERAGAVNVADCIKEQAEAIKASVKKTVSVHFQLDDNLPVIFISREDIKEILFELVYNADDAIADSGVITIKTAMVELTSAQDIDIDYDVKLNPGQYLHLSVADTGCGISDDIRLHIYDPFFTTKEFTDKSGMGLASVYGLVKLHNGFITFDSVVNKGTIFHVYLPVLESQQLMEKS